jgi:HK97 family phage prohead protease
MLARNDAFARTSITPDGMVEGYASLFSEIDSARDMVMPGAFAQTLRTRGLRRIPMLFQHDPAEPIGIWLELIEDSRGLYARGRLIPDVQRGREVLALVKSGAIDGLSIGFKTVKGRVDPRTRIRRIEQVDLWEISIVTFPLLTGARVRAVKGAETHESDRHERLFRRHPRFSFARTRAEAEWKTIFRGAAPDARASDVPLMASSLGPGATRLDRVHARRQAQPSRRERRIRNWIAPSALLEMADRKALLERPSR